MAPMFDHRSQFRAQSERLYACVAAEMRAQGLRAGPRSAAGPHDGARGRFGWWLAEYLGPLHAPLEVNSQAPQRHLRIEELCEAAGPLLLAATRYLSSGEGAAVLKEADRIAGDRRTIQPPTISPDARENPVRWEILNRVLSTRRAGQKGG